MEIVRSLVAPCDAATLFVHLDDLDRYGAWMALVHGVERVADAEPPTWDVELRATLGPFARSKRLRMRRTDYERDRRVVFERAEADGRTHAPWVLRADLVEQTSTATELTMTLRYGGNLWTGAVLQRVLDDEVERGSRRLVELVSEAPTR